MRKNWARRIAKFLAIVIVGAAVLTFVVMTLWNWLAPALFGLPSITVFQALGLLVLCRILFGGFRGRGGLAHPHGRRLMMERWEQMTPEEREKFRQGLLKGMQPSGSSERST